MAMLNDRDVRLHDGHTRNTNPRYGKSLTLNLDTPVFQVAGVTPSPSAITLTGVAVGFDTAPTLTFTRSDAGTLTGTGNTRSLAYTDLSTTSVSVTVTCTVAGEVYTDTKMISKVVDGSSSGLSNAVFYAYQRSASAPTLKPGDVTYTFASASITTPSTDALANGWTKSIPAGSNPLYVTAASASGSGTTDTVLNAEWAAPVLFVQDGSTGPTSATVYIYKRTTTNSAPTLPSVSSTYTFVGGTISGLNNGWTGSVPAASGGAYLWVSTATALATSTTDSIPASEWSTPPQLMAQDGGEGTGLFLSSTAQAITFDGNNAYSPGSQSISFTAKLTGTIAGNTATWSCIAYYAAGGVQSFPTLGGSGNTRTLAQSDFGTVAAYAVVTATYTGGFSDTITVVKLSAGSDALVGYLTNESHTVPASSAGVVSSFSGASGTFKVFKGTLDVTSSCTFSTIADPDSLTDSPPTGGGGGAYSVTAAGSWASGSNTTYITYRATYGGVNIDKTFSITKALTGTGTAGQRGSRMFYLSGYSAWSSSAAATAAAVDGGPVLKDYVTEYNTGTGFTQSRVYNGGTPTSDSSWDVITQVIDGGLLVTGSVAATTFIGSSFVGYTFTGATFRTAASGQRVEIDGSANKLKVIDGSGNTVVDLGGATGTVFVIGSDNITPMVYGKSTSSSVNALYPAAVFGESAGHTGVRGQSTDGYGVHGQSVNSHGVVGAAASGSQYDFYATGAGANYGPFTGAHDVLWPNAVSIPRGDIVVDRKCVARAGLSNTLFHVERSSRPNQKAVIGVLVTKGRSLNGIVPAVFQDDPEGYAAVKDWYMAGAVNALGEGQINVCGEGGNIEAGDLIVTSSVPGKGMRQADDLVRGYTVAKAREDCTFEGDEIKTVACIYLCG